MKKYDMKKIMKKAWEISRKLKTYFGRALKISWFLAKKEIELKEEYSARSTDGIVTFNIWEGYGKLRAYYKLSWWSNYQNGRGHFIEIEGI